MMLFILMNGQSILAICETNKAAEDLRNALVSEYGYACRRVGEVPNELRISIINKTLIKEAMEA